LAGQTSEKQELRHEDLNKGSRLQRLESECFAGCSLQTIQLPAGLKALPSSCFMDANVEELTFESGRFCAELKQNVSVNVT
jgi:hypothetical protein